MFEWCDAVVRLLQIFDSNSCIKLQYHFDKNKKKNIKGLNFIFGNWRMENISLFSARCLHGFYCHRCRHRTAPQMGCSPITFEVCGTGCTDCVASRWGSSSREAGKARPSCSKQNWTPLCLSPWQISEHTRELTLDMLAIASIFQSRKSVFKVSHTALRCLSAETQKCSFLYHSLRNFRA